MNPVEERYEDFLKAAVKDGIRDSEETKVVFVAGFTAATGKSVALLRELTASEELVEKFTKNVAMLQLLAMSIALGLGDPRMRVLVESFHNRFGEFDDN